MRRTKFVRFCEECPFYHEVDHCQGVDEHCTLGYDMHLLITSLGWRESLGVL